MTPLVRAISSFLAVFTLGVVARAQSVVTVVDWGTSSSYVSSDQLFNTYTADGRTFSLTTQFSPQSGYSGPVFYGGAERVGTNGTGTWNTSAGMLVRNNTTAAQSGSAGLDAIRFYPTWTGTSGDGQQKFYGAVAFKKDDFLNNGSTGTVSFTGSENVNMAFFLASSGYQLANTNFRVIVQNGSNWYISNAISYTAGTLKTVNATFGSTFTSWNNYDTSTLSVVGSSVTPTFDNVQAVGFLWTLSSLNSAAGGSNGSAFVSDFTFNATVTAIPEPSTYAALAGVLALVGVLVHRRRRAAKPAGAA